jgi:hypothetical protein
MTLAPARSVLQTGTTSAQPITAGSRARGDQIGGDALEPEPASGRCPICPTIVARSNPELVGKKIQRMFNLASAGSQETMTACERRLPGMLEVGEAAPRRHWARHCRWGTL